MGNKIKVSEIIPGILVKEDQQSGKPLEQEKEVVDMERGQKAGIPTLKKVDLVQAAIYMPVWMHMCRYRSLTDIVLVSHNVARDAKHIR